jgi:hypothetical protein
VRHVNHIVRVSVTPGKGFLYVSSFVLYVLRIKDVQLMGAGKLRNVATIYRHV